MSTKRDAATAFAETHAATELKHKKRKSRGTNRGKGEGQGAEQSTQIQTDANHLAPSGSMRTDYEDLNASRYLDASPRKRRKSLHKIKDKQDLAAESSSGKAASVNGESKHGSGKQQARQKAIQHTTKHNSRKYRDTSRTVDGWRLSPSTGAYFLNQDPILTKDGKYLILPTHPSVELYSAATSLLVRRLDVENISSCIVSAKDASLVFVSTYGGKLIIWNWTTGRIINQIPTVKPLLKILGVLHASEEEPELLLILAGGDHNKEHVYLLNFSIPSDPSTTQTTVFSHESFLPTACIAADGSTIVLCTSDKMILGRRNKSPTSAWPNYTWRELSVSGQIESMDARFRQVRGKSARDRLGVDVVLGFESGVVQVYNDILQKVQENERNSKAPQISSRRLHWHRGPVSTVKWSRDGNYIISGGTETVLVIWQLDTNQQQFLPHISTAICNLSVSEQGSSYVLRLADNSVMALATADLLPYANICGLAMAGRVPTAAAMHPRNTSCLVVAASAAASAHSFATATMLQTYDIGTGLQVGRQALTRNMITAINVSPSGQKLVEPNVKFVRLSHDGTWLCTVDEWQPPKLDLEPLYTASTEELKKPETCLRFWSWDEQARMWELVTRVDGPHSEACVLGLVSHPSRAGFATVGSDGVLSLWTLKSRVRSGIAVKNASGKELHTWTCSWSLQVQQESLDNPHLRRNSAAVDYSNDGSVIAVSWSAAGLRYVHFVDTREQSVPASEPNLISNGHARLSFLGRYLLCLSTSFCVFDTVSMQKTFSISLDNAYVDKYEAGFLATNNVDGTFALGLNATQLNSPAQLVVYNVRDLHAGPCHQCTIRGRLKVLLANPQSPGFVVVDDRANVRRLVSPGVTDTERLMRPEPEEVKRGLDSIFGRPPVKSTEVNAASNPQSTLSGPEAQQGQQGVRSLEAIVATQSTSKLPSVQDLFNKIAGLFSRTAVAVQ